MKVGFRRIFSIFVCGLAVIALSDSASEGSDVFVVSARLTGDAAYMISNGDGTFSSQENLPPASGNGIRGNSYGNAVGDFDNDGDLDYIMGIGIDSGEIYIFENLDSRGDFTAPMPAASWSEGFFPMDMAVADFNEDGNLDFVMSYLYSFSCGLYLGDGMLGFTGPESNLDTDPLLLKTAADFFSAGADSADFNNDTHADFIIAPYGPNGKFYVHLGNGDGTFQVSTFDSNAGAAYYGAATADFDHDGFVDLAAVYTGYMDIYLGNNDGTFSFDHRMEDDGFKLSAIDNYDFNNDGYQDLTAANIGPAGDGVAVYLGNGDGTFTYLDTYSGGSSGPRYTISAPPAKVNIDPVAIVDPTYLEVFVGEEIVLDGSQSYDEDGEIVNYEWDFGEGQPSVLSQLSALTSNFKSDIKDVSPVHIYHEAGSYTAKLTVTDDKGAKSSVQAEVFVSEIPIINVKVRFYPRRLHLKSRSKWIWATIRPPAGYDARKIDEASVCIGFENGSSIYAQPDRGRGFLANIRKRICRQKRSLTVKFDRQALFNALEGSSGRTILNIEGMMNTEDDVSKIAGSGKIRILTKEKKKSYFHRLKKRQIKRVINHLTKKRGSKTCRYYRH